MYLSHLSYKLCIFSNNRKGKNEYQQASEAAKTGLLLALPLLRLDPCGHVRNPYLALLIS